MAQVTTLRAKWGERIREARQVRGLTISKLARLADIDQGALSRIERGIQGASDENRIKIAGALGMEVSELFTYPPVKHSPVKKAS